MAAKKKRMKIVDETDIMAIIRDEIVWQTLTKENYTRAGRKFSVFEIIL
jgi:hypothetical protein